MCRQQLDSICLADVLKLPQILRSNGSDGLHDCGHSMQVVVREESLNDCKVAEQFH